MIKNNIIERNMLADLLSKAFSEYWEDMKGKSITDSMTYKQIADYLLIYGVAVKLPEVTLEEMDISVRTYNCLKRSGVNTLEDLSKYTTYDLMRVRNLGRRGFDEIIEKCKEYSVIIGNK